MFYETAQTIGPGWHRSYKPSHYEDMTWSPSSKNFRSPGSSPETYRRIIHNDEDFPKRSKEPDEDDFFSGRRSPTFPRRIFKEVWSESPSSNHRFSDRPRLFKRVFKPDHWEDDFERNIPHIRRVERTFDHDFDDDRPMPRTFDDEFEKRFNARDLKKDIQEEFQKAEGRVHHIPIMVEKRMEEMKSHFGRKTPPPERVNDEEYEEEWVGPQVQNLRKTFEPEENFSSKYRHRYPNIDIDSRPRSFTNPVSDTWDPHAVHTLPTRRAHKNSQSFDDSRHPVSPKSVFRSYSETHEDLPRQQPQHSAAFRSHSDGHCPKKTYVTKIEVNLPSQKEKEELRSRYNDKKEHESSKENIQSCHPDSENVEQKPSGQTSADKSDESHSKPKMKSKPENSSLQQIAVILQNVEDLVKRVEAYNGTGRDKQYRFLDEMLTRCMLRLDDVDTEGREDIRSARKAAVREVQSCIDKLEAKAEESERRIREQEQQQPQQSTENPERRAVLVLKDAERDAPNEDKKAEEQSDSSNKEQDKESPKEEVTNNGAHEQTKL